MGKFFDIDGGFFRGMTRVADFIILDIMMIIFCIPVVTIGPAISAAYYVALKEVRNEEGYLIRSFWKAFKQNFSKGFLIELVIIVAAVVLYFDVTTTYKWAFSEQSMVGKLLFYVFLGIVLIVFSAVIYVFPMLAKFDNTVIKLLKNSMMMSMKQLPQTIIMVFITGGLIYATITYPPFIVFSIGLSLYVNAYIMARIFDLYIPKDAEEENPDDFHVDMN